GSLPKDFFFGGEITMEANPDSVSPAYLKTVHSIGINRLSFGAQSCVNRELQALGRRHDAHQIEEAVIWSKAAGFKNLSLDVMIGIPYQTQKSLDETLQFMTNLSPTHLSCYLLKIEENTPFYRQHVENLCANEDQTADFYLHTIDFLAAHGYEQYEISNFCRQGMESRHNLKYWRCMEYLGFGVAAHSFYRGKRFFHTNSLSDYLDSPKIEQVADGSGGGIAEEILLRLRLTEGFDLWRLKNENQRENMVQKSRRYCENGLMRLKNDNLSFTPQGFLLSNPILSELLADL
ncbi:MAG: coproporphyrinogen-III oxidase family protein, partial [Oscillospiraceae bacterium]